MNIREHIEAGHYERDSKGRALVPMDCGCVATIYATDYSEPFPIVAVSGAGKWTHHFDGDGKLVYPTDVAGYRLLPPTPRKVKVTRWAILDGKNLRDGEPRFVASSHAFLHSSQLSEGEFIVEMIGEYEEPWS